MVVLHTARSSEAYMGTGSEIRGIDLLHFIAFLLKKYFRFGFFCKKKFSLVYCHLHYSYHIPCIPSKEIITKNIILLSELFSFLFLCEEPMS